MIDDPHPPAPEASAEICASWEVEAHPRVVPQMRRRIQACVAAGGASRDLVQTIGLAVSEVVTNAVIHACPETDEPRPITVSCAQRERRSGAMSFCITVADLGSGIDERRPPRGIGHGLALVGALARDVSITSGPAGTRVTMLFSDEDPAVPRPRDLDTLCALALDTIADAACVDLIRAGVLRRVCAQVAGDPEASDWLARSLPPARPGTATWAALRDGSPRLVVHDPGTPRTPGGPGERLGLTWWIAVPLSHLWRTPVLWGFGGRSGGHPEPPETILDLLDPAQLPDLSDPQARAVLAERLRTHTSG